MRLNFRYHNIDDKFDMKNTKVSRKKQIEKEQELKNRQRVDIHPSKKLRPNDIHRIVQHTSNSIFDYDKCCIWLGYVTNLKNKKKGTYINFYFKDKKKVALHRLLYINFKGDISTNEYIKYSCENKGKCCNINHMIKYQYNINDTKYNSDIDTDSDIDILNEESFKIVIY